MWYKALRPPWKEPTELPSGRSSARSRPLAFVSALILAAGLMVTAFPLHPVRVNAQGAPKQLAVFSPQSTYSTPLLDINGQRYVGAVELLEPLGSVESKTSGKKLKLRFTPPGGRQQELDLQDGKDAAKLNGNKLKLLGNFVLQGGRGYLPLAAIPELLPRFGLQPVELRGSQRLFIGNSGERFTAELKKGTPSRLILAFPAAVNPTVATEPGKVRLTFKREPVIGLFNSVHYEDPLITGVSYSEHDGIAELEITGTQPMMANFADGNKTIIVSAAPGPPTQAVQQLPVQVPQSATALPPPVPQPPTRPRFLVLIDPAHGGNEIGAAITPQLPEKDVVLALARRVQRELSARGIAASLLRNGDYAIALEQRALSINAARPALYIALHAANTGKGVHVFTAMLGAENAPPGGFLPWDTAQAAFIDLSGSVAGSISAELETRKVANSTLPAPLRPVNNVAAPAVGIEIAPPGTDVNEIAGAGYQTQVAQSIAAGVAAARAKLPEVRP
jgi:N-acetylmuramoyl-L-alanine amidase